MISLEKLSSCHHTSASSCLNPINATFDFAILEDLLDDCAVDLSQVEELYDGAYGDL